VRAQALDYQFDVTAAGRTLKLLHVVDEFTRESLSDLVGYSIDTDATVAVLDKIAAVRGFPEFIRCDNVPELTPTPLRDWCRFTGAGASYFASLLEAQVLVAGWWTCNRGPGRSRRTRRCPRRLVSIAGVGIDGLTWRFSVLETLPQPVF
jgi:hypothetical protein